MNTQGIIWGLEELSDREEQVRIWANIGNSEGGMSSFGEAICRLFDDAGLGFILDSERKRTEVSPELLEIADKLDRLVRKVPQDLDELDIINHPAMEDVRATAKEMLLMLKTEGSE
jgi:hypothetical protein